MLPIRIALLFCLTLLCGHWGIAQKTDRVLLDNNDWVTGEIKKLDYAKLSYKTDAAGTIQIKWDRIYQIKSDKFFEIILSEGEKYFGSLDLTSDNDKYKLLIITTDDSLEIDMNLIVEITPIKNRFWTRIDGSVDMGFSYTKASDVKQWNSSLQLSYRSTKSLTSLTGSSIMVNQPGLEPTSKQDLGLSFRRLLGGNFSYTGFTSLQQNSELGIELRTAVGTGLSKNWIRSNLARLISTAGIIVNRENSYESTVLTTNLEGLFRLEYQIFRYRDPEIYITAYGDLYPSFTVSGRYRTDANLQFKYEFFKDFFFGLTFYHNYDSKPPEGANSGTDWGVTTSLGWTF